MEIVRIFDDHLFSFKHNNCENEFSRLFDFWSDIEQLEEFFEANKYDLQKPFWNYLSVKDAIYRTIQESGKLEDSFRNLSKQTTDKLKGLDSLFRPLNDLQTHVVELNKSKAKQNWLRMYALKIENNAYLITGGAIKLTQTMQERKHTQLELNKINSCHDYLLRKGIIDRKGIIEAFEL
jgi:hypothetical protein